MASDADERAIWARFPTAAGATLLLWFILLVFGGGCLAWYYSSINYFPRIAWEESLSYLAVLSIIGGGLAVAFGLLAFLPGVIWSEVLLADCKLGDSLRYVQANGDKEPCLIKIFKIVGIPFAVFTFVIHLCIGVATVVTSGSDWIIGVGALLSLSLATYLFVRRVTRALDEQKLNQIASPFPIETLCLLTGPDTATKAPDTQVREPATSWFHSSMAKYVAAFMTSAALGLVALLMIENLLGADAFEREIVMWVMCASVVVVANVFVAGLYWSRRRAAAALVAALATLGLLVVGEWYEGSSSLLHRVMESYGMGEGTRYVLVVTKEGRSLLEAQGVHAEGHEGEPGRVRNVAVLSRLGDEFLFRCGGLKISLPGEMVVSWSAGTLLSNLDLMALAKAGRPSAILVRRIQDAALVEFDLSKGGLEKLRRQGVLQDVVDEMLRRESCDSCSAGGFAGCVGARRPMAVPGYAE
jgi:hypothetical protein